MVLVSDGLVELLAAGAPFLVPFLRELRSWNHGPDRQAFDALVVGTCCAKRRGDSSCHSLALTPHPSLHRLPYPELRRRPTARLPRMATSAVARAKKPSSYFYYTDPYNKFDSNLLRIQR